MDFKNIHIGKMIEMRAQETQMNMMRACNFLKCTEEDIQKTYNSESLDSQILLRWSKLLQYDFFRVYSQHILLFASASQKETVKNKKSILPKFRKNIYTKEIIEFILDSLASGEKTKQQIIDNYRIPKTTLYKWISKYNYEKK